jgi:hypothetical protein
VGGVAGLGSGADRRLLPTAFVRRRTRCVGPGLYLCEMNDSQRASLEEKLAGCGACGLKLQQPVLLPCMHIFCKTCFPGPKLSIGLDILACPVCAFSPISPEHVKPLDDPQIFQSIVEVVLGQESLCEECSSQCASVHCQKCEVVLCTGCYESTHASRLYRAHPTTELAFGRKPRPEPRCDAHPVERTCFIRLADQRLLCRDCVLLGGLAYRRPPSPLTPEHTQN